MTERFSMEGWKIGKWIAGNGKTIKEVLKIGLPLLAAGSITADPALIAIGTAFGKFVLDVVDYYLKQN